jgi:hypothetical protein
MKDIFRPEDFNDFVFGNYPKDMQASAAVSHFANARFRSWLEENGKKVYLLDNGHPSKSILYKQYEWHTHTAYLIGVEEIKKCEHPKEKVAPVLAVSSRCPPGKEIIYWECECNAQVEPYGFRAIGERDEVK